MGVILGAVVGVTSVAVVEYNLIPKDYLFIYSYAIGMVYVILTTRRHKTNLRYFLAGFLITIIGGLTSYLFPLDLRFLYGFSIGFLATSIRRVKNETSKNRQGDI